MHEPEDIRRKSKEHSASFMDPFNLTIYTSEAYEEEDDDDDDPTFNITLGEEEMKGLDDKAAADIIFGCSDEDEEYVDESDTENEVAPAMKKIAGNGDIDTLLEDKCALVFFEQLKTLAQLKVDGNCLVKGCNDTVKIDIYAVGSAVYVTWICGNSHIKQKWCSQPIMNRSFHSGDLLCSSAILLSGNNFAKMQLFAKFLKLHFPSASSYDRIKRTYLLGAIEETWEEQQQDLLGSLKDAEVTVLGDGRMDSPGHCAQYCTYSLMDNSSKKIISISTLDKRQTARKSTNLEKAGFMKGMEEIRGKGVNVSEVVTDQRLQIGAVMKRQYPNIHHSFGMWLSLLGKKS